jgi:hypothetical protein
LVGKGWRGCSSDTLCSALVSLVAVEGDYRRAIRHDLGHLFALELGLPDPPLKGEGLAEWLVTKQLLAPGEEELVAHFVEAGYGVSDLLEPSRGNAPEGRNAPEGSWAKFRLVALSFTRFLISDLGWEKYCEFYAQSGSTSDQFTRALETTFGQSFAAIDRKWQLAFEVSTVKVGKRSVNTPSHGW